MPGGGREPYTPRRDAGEHKTQGPKMSISSANAERLSYSYLQDMRDAPLTSPGEYDDIGSDIDMDEGQGAFHFR